MASITAPDLSALRRLAARHAGAVNYTKAQANSAFQAIEDWEVGGHTLTPVLSRAQAIENAVGVPVPLRLEKVLWMAWSEWKQRQLLTEI